MNLFLDSSAVIEFLKSNQRVIDAISGADEVYTSSICAYEVLVGEEYVRAKGGHSSYDSTRRFFDTISTLRLDYSDAVNAAKLSATLMLKGKKIDDFDALIASQALSRGAEVLTKDRRHFGLIGKETGLKIEGV